MSFSIKMLIGKKTFVSGSLHGGALTSLLALAFLFGGGARGDIVSLIWLRPLAIIALAYGLWMLRPEHVRRHRFLFAMAAAILGLVIVHLMPLPPTVWQSLPGRELVVGIGTAVGMDDAWRPLSMVPTMTWNALYSLSVPLAALLLMSRLTTEELAKLVPVFVALLLLTAFVGVLQAAGLPLRFFNVDNPYAGLFANRNHQALALACLFPLLAVFASEETPSRWTVRTRRWLALGIGVAVLPLLFITGSRAGLAICAMALATLPLLIRIDARRMAGKRRPVLVAATTGTAALIAILLGWLSFESGRNTALARLLSKDLESDARFPMWRTTSELIEQNWPAGSGIGSFIEVFQTVEPQADLSVQYVNHAHNDWLEVLMTGGLPAAVLLAIASAAFLLATMRAFRKGLPPRHEKLKRLGIVIIAMCGVSSIVDYPLRTPALATLFVFAAFLASIGPPRDRRNPAGPE